MSSKTALIPCLEQQNVLERANGSLPGRVMEVRREMVMVSSTTPSRPREGKVEVFNSSCSRKGLLMALSRNKQSVLPVSVLLAPTLLLLARKLLGRSDSLDEWML